jgi:hypothetical protein
MLVQLATLNAPNLWWTQFSSESSVISISWNHVIHIFKIHLLLSNFLWVQSYNRHWKKSRRKRINKRLYELIERNEIWEKTTALLRSGNMCQKTGSGPWAERGVEEKMPSRRLGARKKTENSEGHGRSVGCAWLARVWNNIPYPGYGIALAHIYIYSLGCQIIFLGILTNIFLGGNV